MDARRLAISLTCALLVGIGCSSALLEILGAGQGGNTAINVKGANSSIGPSGSDAGSTSDGGTSTDAGLDDGGSGQTGLLDLGQGIEVKRARIVVAKLALEGRPASDGGMPASDAGAADGGDDGEHPENEVNLGPLLIDLSGRQLAGNLVKIFDAEVPPGTYHEIRVVVGPAGGADAGVPPAIAAMNGSSVIIEGTVSEPLTDGGSTTLPFGFASSLRAAQRDEVEMNVTVNNTTHNVTLTIDPTGWFKGPNGSRLDPTLAANQASIEDNIKDSIRAKGGDDDGEHGDDHGRDGGDHGGDGGDHGGDGGNGDGDH